MCLYQSDDNFLFNDDFVFSLNFRHSYKSQLYKILTYALHEIWCNLFFNKFHVNLLLKVDFAYFPYSHQGGSITSEHCLTDILYS